MRMPDKQVFVICWGKIAPFEGKPDGQLSAISIETADRRYVIANNSRGQELFDFIDEEVRVTGELVTDPHGREVIIVEHYSFLNEGPVEHPAG